MKNKQRMLTEKEAARQEKFDAFCAEMKTRGYTATPKTIGVVEANVAALFIMLPFAAIMVWLFWLVNRTADLAFMEHFLIFYVLLLVSMAAAIVIHELIHGLVWGICAKSHFKSIEFGVIWKALTPYCTCSEPLKRRQYILGSAMPTLILGFAMGAVAIVCNWLPLFFLAEVMIFGGGGDFLVILKMLKYRQKTPDTLYIDHPTECGFVVLEK